MTNTPNSDEEIVLAVFSTVDKARLEKLDRPEKELMFNSTVLGFRKAEELLIPIITRLEEENERLTKAYFQEIHEIEDILGKATGNVVTQEIKNEIGGEVGEGFFCGHAPIEVATLVARHINRQAEEIAKARDAFAVENGKYVFRTLHFKFKRVSATERKGR